jgi:signal transduction histidine kinase
MERHFRREHSPDLINLVSHSQNMGSRTSTFKTQNPNCYNSSDIFSLLSLNPQSNSIPNTQASTGLTAAATIEKMHRGKKLQSLLISNDPLYVTHFTSIFEELWKSGIDAADRMRNIEEGGDATSIEIIDNPREALKLVAEMVSSAKEEVLRVYPSVNAFRRQVKVGSLNLFGEVITRNVKVRIVIPSNEEELKEMLNYVNEVGLVVTPVLPSSQLEIRSIDKSLQTHIGIIVVDRKQSLIVESKDDIKENYYEAAGLAAYSNSRQIALSYASIFESLWKQTEMYERSRTYSRMQKEFINVAAHELWTPVQPIIGLADDLYSKAQDRRQKEALEVIFRNARRLQRLVEDILDVTKIESD